MGCNLYRRSASKNCKHFSSLHRYIITCRMNVPKMQFFCKNDLLMIFFWEKVNKHKFIKINTACAFVVATCSV